jgi:glucarate dehydratase
VIPVAGHDSMRDKPQARTPLLHPQDRDSEGQLRRYRLGTVSGGDKIRQTLEDVRPLVVGQSIGNMLTAISTTNTVPVVRVPWLDPGRMHGPSAREEK